VACEMKRRRPRRGTRGWVFGNALPRREHAALLGTPSAASNRGADSYARISGKGCVIQAKGGPRGNGSVRILLRIR
jgi:hypothetical protein